MKENIAQKGILGMKNSRWLRTEWLASPPTLLEVSSETSNTIFRIKNRFSDFLSNIWRIHYPGEVNTRQKTLFHRSSTKSSGWHPTFDDLTDSRQWWHWWQQCHHEHLKTFKAPIIIVLTILMAGQLLLSMLHNRLTAFTFNVILQIDSFYF